MKKVLSVVMAAIMLLCAEPFNVSAFESLFEKGRIYVAGVPVSTLSNSYWVNDGGSITENGANSSNYNLKVVAGVDSEGNPSSFGTEVYFRNLDISCYDIFYDETAISVYAPDIMLNIILEGRNKITVPDMAISDGINSAGLVGLFSVSIKGKGKLTINMGAADHSVGILGAVSVGISDGADVTIVPSEKVSNQSIGIESQGVAVYESKLTVESGPANIFSYGINADFSAYKAEVFAKSGDCHTNVETVSAGINTVEMFVNNSSEVKADGGEAASSYGVLTKEFKTDSFNSNVISGYSKAISAEIVDVAYYDPDRYFEKPVTKISLSESVDGSNAVLSEYDGDAEALKEKLSNVKYAKIETIKSAFFYRVIDFFNAIVDFFKSIFSF